MYKGGGMEHTYRIFWEVEGIITLVGEDMAELNSMADRMECPIRDDHGFTSIEQDHMGWDQMDKIKQATVYWKDGTKDIFEANSLIEFNNKYIFPSNKEVQVIANGNNDDYFWDAPFTRWLRKPKKGNK